MSDIPDLAGLPFPLWIARSDQSLVRLLPAGCAAQADRRSWLLFVCLEGQVPLLRRGQPSELHAGEVLLSELPHNGLSLRREVARWRALACGFIGFDELVQDLQSRSDSYRVPVDGWLVKQLAAMADQPPTLDLAAAVRLVSGMLVNLIERNIQGLGSSPQSQLLRQAVALLNQSVERPVAISLLATELGISRGHFAKIVREGLGITPNRYLQERRVRRACELLRAGNEDIASIARRLCYDSTSAFTAVFRQSTGMTPTDYRNSRSVPVWD